MDKKTRRTKQVAQTARDSSAPQAEMENLQAIGRAIVQTIGEYGCEVIIHDLADLEHSIVWVDGQVTSRGIGGAMTDFGISKVRAGDFRDATAARRLHIDNVVSRCRYCNELEPWQLLDRFGADRALIRDKNVRVRGNVDEQFR